MRKVIAVILLTLTACGGIETPPAEVKVLDCPGKVTMEEGISLLWEKQNKAIQDGVCKTQQVVRINND